ncbi:MAG: hypothetical protein NTY64_23770, partial [Deltaproteobacteria bacterium]|nr:hypothetical protein [Deltaproteobacteria bacterium]
MDCFFGAPRFGTVPDDHQLNNFPFQRTEQFPQISMTFAEKRMRISMVGRRSRKRARVVPSISRARFSTPAREVKTVTSYPFSYRNSAVSIPTIPPPRITTWEPIVAPDNTSHAVTTLVSEQAARITGRAPLARMTASGFSRRMSSGVA